MLSGHIGCKRWLIKLSRSGEELGSSYPNFSASYSCMCSLLWKGSQLRSAAGVTCDLDSVWLAPISILRWFCPHLGLCSLSRLLWDVALGSIWVCALCPDFCEMWLWLPFGPSLVIPSVAHARETAYLPSAILLPLLQSDSTTTCPAYTRQEPGMLWKAKYQGSPLPGHGAPPG